MFFNKLTFIQNTVPKEYDAAKHASKVRHEAPVLMFLKKKKKKKEEDPFPPLTPPLSTSASGWRDSFLSKKSQG